MEFPDLEPEEMLMDGMLLLDLEDGYQTAFINPDAIDYIIVPTHKYLKGETDDSDEVEEDWKRYEAANKKKKKH